MMNDECQPGLRKPFHNHTAHVPAVPVPLVYALCTSVLFLEFGIVQILANSSGNQSYQQAHSQISNSEHFDRQQLFELNYSG